MGESELDALGPIDYIVVEFPAGEAAFTGEMGAEIERLVDAGTVRVLDLLIIKKEEDGSYEGHEVHDFEHDAVAGLRELGAEAAMVLGHDDVAAIADILEPGTVAAVLVWENTWAAPFASAVRRSGGQLVSDGRIPMQAVVAALEADAAAVADSEGA